MPCLEARERGREREFVPSPRRITFGDITESLWGRKSRRGDLRRHREVHCLCAGLYSADKHTYRGSGCRGCNDRGSFPSHPRGDWLISPGRFITRGPVLSGNRTTSRNHDREYKRAAVARIAACLLLPSTEGPSLCSGAISLFLFLSLGGKRRIHLTYPREYFMESPWDS